MAEQIKVILDLDIRTKELVQSIESAIKKTSKNSLKLEVDEKTLKKSIENAIEKTKTKPIEAKIKPEIDEPALDRRAGQVGRGVGSTLGSELSRAVGVALGAISFGAVVQSAGRALDAIQKVRKAQASLAGSIQAANQDSQVIDADAVESEVEDLFNTLGKQAGVSKTVIQKGFADLFRADVTDIEQASGLLEGFIKTASTGKSEFISTSDAVSQLTEQFRTERSELGEAAGLMDEYLSDILPRGLELLQAEGKLRGKKIDDLTKEEKALAKTVGLQENFNLSEFQFQKQLEAGSFTKAQATLAIEELNEALGAGLIASRDNAYAQLLPAIKEITTVITDNPEIVPILFGTAAGLAAIATSALVLGGPITAGILLAAGAITALGKAWQDNTGGMRDNLQSAVADIETELNKLGLDLQDLAVFAQLYLGLIGSTFVNVASTVGNGVALFLGAVASMLEGVNQIRTGILLIQDGNLKLGLQTFFGGIERIITTPFKAGFNGVIVLANQFIRQFNSVMNALPDSVKERFGNVQVPEFQQIAFATGGLVPGQNTSALLNDGKGRLAGQEFVMNAPATRMFKPILDRMNQQGSSISGSYNTTNYNNVGSFTPSLSSQL